MFSALSLGSLIYLLDKTPTLKYFTGEVIGVSFPKYNLGSNLVDLKVKTEEGVLEFNNLPSINSYVTYNNGKLIISETKQAILNEVENVLQTSKLVLDNIDNYKQNISNCENILKQLNPLFAKDKERDERLGNLETRFEGVESKLDKIYELIKK